MTLLDAVTEEVRRYLALPKFLLEAEPAAGAIRVRVSEYAWSRRKHVVHAPLRATEFSAATPDDVLTALAAADFLVLCPHCGAHTEIAWDRPLNNVVDATRHCTAPGCRFRCAP
jgi:hypothetical protein